MKNEPRFVLLPVLLTSAFVVGCSCLRKAKVTTAPLVASVPVTLSGPAGHFDFMAADSTRDRMLAAHKGARTLEILNLKTDAQLKAVAVGAAQGVAIDSKHHRYFTGDEGEHSVSIVDSQKLKKIGEVKTDGPVDAIEFDPRNGHVYAAKDDGDRIWVINVAAKKVIKSIMIPGTPEVLVFDKKTDRIYLNIRSKNEIAVINPIHNTIEKTWSTLPVESPHGLIVDEKAGRLYSAGHNGELAAIDIKTGKVVSTAKIANGVDQIAYDPAEHIIYSACHGYISATKITKSGLQPLGDTPAHIGAHTIAVDPIRHNVWVVYSDSAHSYFQKFTLNRSAAKSTPPIGAD